MQLAARDVFSGAGGWNFSFLHASVANSKSA
jgi:hypothetical protein